MIPYVRTDPGSDRRGIFMGYGHCGVGAYGLSMGGRFVFATDLNLKPKVRVKGDHLLREMGPSQG